METMAADRYKEKPYIWEEKGNWDSLPGQWRFWWEELLPRDSKVKYVTQTTTTTTKQGDLILLFQITAGVRMTNKDADSHGFLDEETQ